MRWALELVERRGGLHLRVRPLDAEASAENAWPTSPKTLCGRRGTPGVCEVCVVGLAGLDTYTRLVITGRLKDEEDDDDQEEPAGGAAGREVSGAA